MDDWVPFRFTNKNGTAIRLTRGEWNAQGDFAGEVVPAPVYSYQQGLWRNGTFRTLPELVGGAGNLPDSAVYSFVSVEGINDTGVIGLTYKTVASPATSPVYHAFALMPVAIGVDNNRDGTLALGSEADQTTEQRPYRFWLNNDYDDNTDDTYSPDFDHPSTADPPDNLDGKVQSKRDLDDLSRIHLRVAPLLSQLRAGTITLGLKWARTIAGTPAIRVFKAVESDGGLDYLSDTAKAADQTSGDPRLAVGVVQVTGGFDFPTSFWATEAAGSTQYLLFEGLGEGKGELTLIIKRGGTVIGQGGSLFLDLLDIRRMYERGRITGSANFPDPDTAAATFVTGAAAETDPNGYGFQSAWDEDATDKSYLIFVHGWRKTYNNARSDEITVFKRLWHRGFKGRFVGFYWPTLIGNAVTAKFNHSEYRAWKCGVAFKQYVNIELKSRYRKCVVAHSLGNVVVSSALNSGARVSRFAMLNAAIPAQCFDPNPALRETAASQTFDTRTIWGHSTYNAWAGGDLCDDPLTRISTLAYRSRVFIVGNTRIVNFFLPSDWSLSGWEANQWGALDWGPGDSKPIDSYDYDVGVDLRYNPAFGTARRLTDADEAMSMVNQSMTKPAGNRAGIHGSIYDDVDLNGPGMAFGDEHEAAFMWIPSKTWKFYEILMTKLSYQPTNAP